MEDANLIYPSFLDSAHTWINDLATVSLGFVLVGVSFSVWLSNSRGSTHSQKLVYLNSGDNKSRAFTWSTMTNYYLSASIDLLSNKTKVDGIFHGARIALTPLNIDAMRASTVINEATGQGTKTSTAPQQQASNHSGDCYLNYYYVCGCAH
ncbi:Lipase member J [Taenia solium]|eukprot:TsM_000268700 transcript=TsM_000268700 gene=TsM_000268700